MIVVESAAFFLDGFHTNIVSIGKFGGFYADLVWVAAFATGLPAVVGGAAFVGQAFETCLAFSSGTIFVFAGEVFALADDTLVVIAFFVDFAVFVGIAGGDTSACAAVDFFAIFEIGEGFAIVRVVATFSACKRRCIADFTRCTVFAFDALDALFAVFFADFVGGFARAIRVRCTFSFCFCRTARHDRYTKQQ